MDRLDDDILKAIQDSVRDQLEKRQRQASQFRVKDEPEEEKSARPVKDEKKEKKKRSKRRKNPRRRKQSDSGADDEQRKKRFMDDIHSERDERADPTGRLKLAPREPSRTPPVEIPTSWLWIWVWRRV